MKNIILILFLSMASCSQKNKEQVSTCNIRLTTENISKIGYNKNLNVDLFINNGNNLIFSYYNSSDKNIYLVPPKLIFEILEEKKVDTDKNVIIKPYIKQVIIDKIYTSFIDNSKKKNYRYRLNNAKELHFKNSRACT